MYDSDRNSTILVTMGAIIALALFMALLWSQPADGQTIAGGGTKEYQTQTTSGLTGTLTFPDALGTKSQSFEMIVNGSPATNAVTISGCMRGGTCTSLATSSSTSNAVISATGGPYDNYQVTWTLTGGSSPTLTFNRTGTISSLGQAAGTVAGLGGGLQGQTVTFNAAGQGILVPNPLSCLGFPNADVCAQIHSCFTQCTNGVCGDEADARGLLNNPPFACASNPLPVAGDTNNAGKLDLPPGEIKVPTCANFNPQNSAEVYGVAIGNASAAGPTLFYPSDVSPLWSVGSGATYCPGLFTWGQPYPLIGTANSNGAYGPYNTHAGTLQLWGHSAPNTICMSDNSGQDNTGMERIGFRDCVVGLVVGSLATQNGTFIHGVYLVKTDTHSSIANTASSGGTPFTIQTWAIANSGSTTPGVMVLSASGGSCASGGNSSCTPFPGAGINIGQDTGLYSAGNCSGGGCLTVPANGSQSIFTGAQISGAYTVGAIADFESVSGWTCTTCTGGAHTASYTFTLTSGNTDFPIDTGANCHLSYAGNCNLNAQIFLSGFSVASGLSGLVGVAYAETSNTVSMWLSCGGCGGTTGAGGMAYANTIDPAIFAGTPFTAAGQFAVNTNLLSTAHCANSTWPGSPSDCSSTAQGSLIVFSQNVVFNSKAGARAFDQLTITNTNAKESSNSEYPIHDFNANGWGGCIVGSHFESTVFAAIEIGQDAKTTNWCFINLYVNSHIGWIQWGWAGGSTLSGGSGLNCNANGCPTGNNHSTAYHISNRYGEPTHISILQNDETTPANGGLGSDVPTYQVVDDGNSNAITTALCPSMSFYLIDGSGNATTSCPPGSLTNGTSFYQGLTTIVKAGVAVQSCNASGYCTFAGVRSGTATNSDLAGEVTLAAGSGTYTFLGTYTSRPECFAVDLTTPANAVTKVVTTTTITFTGTGTDVIGYGCLGRN